MTRKMMNIRHKSDMDAMKALNISPAIFYLSHNDDACSN